MFLSAVAILGMLAAQAIFGLYFVMALCLGVCGSNSAVASDRLAAERSILKHLNNVAAFSTSVVLLSLLAKNTSMLIFVPSSMLRVY